MKYQQMPPGEEDAGMLVDVAYAGKVKAGFPPPPPLKAPLKAPYLSCKTSILHIVMVVSKRGVILIRV